MTADVLCADGDVAHSFATKCMLVSFTMTTGRCSARIMTTFTQLAPPPSDPPEPFTDRLRLAVAAYLAPLNVGLYIGRCPERGGDERVPECAGRDGLGDPCAAGDFTDDPAPGGGEMACSAARTPSGSG